MGARPITDELVRQVASELRERHGLDAEDVRELGQRLASAEGLERRTANLEFAERFVDEHRETFDRLGQ